MLNHFIKNLDKNLFIPVWFFRGKMVFGIIPGYVPPKVNLKISIKGLLYYLENDVKNFISQFFDENLLPA